MSRLPVATAPQVGSQVPLQMHKYITRNSEYLVRGDRCLAARDRQALDGTGKTTADAWRVLASVRWRRDGGYDLRFGDMPEIGDSLLLGELGNAILTTAVQRIDR